MANLSMSAKPNEFTQELIKILNHQYENHHFDGIVQWFVDQALERSGYTLTPLNYAMQPTPNCGAADASE